MKIDNCLVYALKVWTNDRKSKIYYNGDHCVNAGSRISGDNYLPIEDYGCEHMLKSFEHISPIYKKRLIEYFDFIKAEKDIREFCQFDSLSNFIDHKPLDNFKQISISLDCTEEVGEIIVKDKKGNTIFSFGSKPVATTGYLDGKLGDIKIKKG